MTVVNRPTGPPVRLVIADVDGALVTQEKVLTARAAEAVRKWIEQIATIGDMPSDVLMFRKSGLSIAMRKRASPTRWNVSSCGGRGGRGVDRQSENNVETLNSVSRG